MQMLILELCSSNAQGLVRDWDLFAPKRSGSNLSCLCIFDNVFLCSAGIL